MSEVVTQLRIPSKTAEQVSGVIVAVIAGESDNGSPLVRWGTGRRKSYPARTVWIEHPPKWSVCKGLPVVLGFEEGDEARPVILGLLEEPPGAEEVPGELPSEAEGTSNGKPKVLRIESAQELILECGKAKIALRADGRVVILGGYVLSRSRGVNKIKGGAVQIN